MAKSEKNKRKHTRSYSPNYNKKYSPVTARSPVYFKSNEGHHASPDRQRDAYFSRDESTVPRQANEQGRSHHR